MSQEEPATPEEKGLTPVDPQGGSEVVEKVNPQQEDQVEEPEDDPGILKITVTLSRLNKVLEGEGKSKKAHRVSVAYGLNDPTSIGVDPGDLLLGTHENYLSKKAEELGRLSSKNALAHRVRVAKIDLKGLLFTANVQTGIHQRLVRLSILQSELEFFTNFKGVIQGSLLTSQEFEAMKSRSGDAHQIRVSGQIYTDTAETADQEIRRIRKEMLGIREAIQAINHGTTVEVRLFKEVAAELGLD